MTKAFEKIALVAVLAFPTVAPALADEPVVIRMATMVPPNTPAATDWFKPWAAQINEKAKGAIKVEVVEGYSVANLNNIYDRISADVVQIGWVIHSLIGGKFPLTEVASLPFLADQAAPLSVALWRLYKTGMLDKEYDDMLPLALQSFSQSQVHYRKAPRTVDNLKGLKISSSSRVQTMLIDKMGGAAINTPPSDFYQSLLRSVVDGSMTSWAAFGPWKLEEVTAYHLEGPFGASTNGFLMLRRKFDSLPQAGRDAIDPDAGETRSRAFAKWLDDQADGYRKPIAADKAHHTVVGLGAAQRAKWKAEAEAVNEAWVADGAGRDRVLAKYRELLAQVEAGH
jgi:TRAP-type C4-dicarboxylate transport system substrate-binding protein